VPHAVDSRTVNNVAEKAMAVSGHRDEVDFLFGCNPDQFGGWIAHRETGIHLEAGAAKFVTATGEVRAIVSYLLRFPQVEVLEVTRGEPIGDVNQEQPRTRQLRQRGDVFKDGLIGFRVFNRNENVVIHLINP
jgi:hypothetical protein